LNKAIWIIAAVFAVTAGITDFRSRRIPNWLTYPAIPLAIALHALAGGWHGAILSLAGAAAGLGVLLPFVLLRSLGGGDWKLVGGLCAFFAWGHQLIDLLVVILLVNAAMAIVVIISKKRLVRTLRNIGRLFASFFRFHLPGEDLTIDSPQATKVPFGVAAAIGVVLYIAWHWRSGL